MIYKRWMTLIEIVIGMALTALLLTTLAYFYQQVNALNSKSDQLQQETFKRLYVQSRLTAVIPKILPHKIQKKICFFTSGNSLGTLAAGSQSLIFVFSTGVELNPDIANKSFARLYLDNQHRLCLAKWKIPKATEQRTGDIYKEILMEGVDSLKFAFFVPPERERSVIEKSDPESSLDPMLTYNASKPWVDEWPRSANFLPPMIKIIIRPTKSPESRNELEPLIFAFPLPHSKKIIVYES